MATTTVARNMQARRAALTAAYLDLLMEGQETVQRLQRQATQNRLEADCMASAVKRFKNDYAEVAASGVFEETNK